MKNNLLYLIQTPYYNDYGPMKKAAGTYFPLGLGYISSYVKRHGAILKDKPALVGVSFMTPQYYAARDMCEAIKSACADTPIALGGAHPSVMAKETLNDIPFCDFAVVREGEETVLELLRALEREGSDLGAIRGLAWRDGNQIVVNEPREPIRDLDSLPFPDRDLIDITLYRAQSFFSYSSKMAAIYTSRGCPGRCVFCCSGHRMRTPVRERGIDNIMAEIDELRSRFNIDYLMVKDDTFTFRKSRALEFCDALLKNHPGLKWHCMGRVNSIDYNLLSRMKEAGLNDIFFGIESGDAGILKKCKKGITLEQSRAAVEACRKLGIRTYGAFILGLPGESRETIENTIRFACSLPLTMAGFSILIPYPGTTVFDEYFRAEPGDPIDYGAFIASSGVHYIEAYKGLNGLSASELPALLASAQKRFYMRPRQLARMIRSASFSMLLGYARGFFSLLSKEIYRRGTAKAKKT
jgi:radical SAM superfamily enzyme YgiQ (UPF0313 family)